MKWRDFCAKYPTMSDTMLKLRAPSLEDMGSGKQVADVVLDMENRAVRGLLVQRAIELGVVFTPADCYALDGEIPTALFVGLIKKGKIVFGNTNVLASLLSGTWDEDGKTALYDRAIKDGVRFTRQQLDAIGTIKRPLHKDIVSAPQNRGKTSLGTLLGSRLLYGRDSKKK